jgi:hypothetical protein
MGLDGKAHLIVKRKEELGPVVARMAQRGARNQNWIGNLFGF